LIIGTIPDNIKKLLMAKTQINNSDFPNFVLLTGTANEPLAMKIAKLLKSQISNPVSVFADGEIRIKIAPNLRRRHVFIIQPTCAPVNDNIIELLLMIDAAKRASSSEVIVVMPYFGYSRQDRKEMARVPISSAVIASMIAHAGADRILTLDIHAEQEEGFIKQPWDNVFASYALVPAIKKKNLDNLVVVSPDKGGVSRATFYEGLLEASELAIVYKERDINLNNKTKALAMVGNVRGKNVLLVDDMIGVGDTIVHAADYLRKKGAKRIFAAATHGLFSGDALEKIEKSALEKVIVTDSVKHRAEVVKNPKIEIVSVAPLLAEAIKRIETGDSISSLILR
jgi:ribose-phosphate pyrophosphokinase